MSHADAITFKFTTIESMVVNFLALAHALCRENLSLIVSIAVNLIMCVDGICYLFMSFTLDLCTYPKKLLSRS